ncbi:MAG TPA: hypothetical protein VG818_08915, partial [Gemmatimonadaceae bacterium]|nr:hypothetical protein [Gemmatimonadaceae bacterium]
MGGGGGAPSHTTTTTQIDPTVKQWEQQNYNYAQNIANTPYSPYSGQMVAPLNSLEMAGITQGSQLSQSNLGMSAINQGIANAIQAGNYSPLQVTAPSSVAQVSAPSGTLQVTAPSSVAQVSAPSGTLQVTAPSSVAQ